MKLKYLLFICVSIVSPFIIAAPDCLDNSWHMQKRGDLKDYHSVQCNCPCGIFTSSNNYRILADRNMCFKCKHYRNPRPIPINKKSHIFLAQLIRTQLIQ